MLSNCFHNVSSEGALVLESIPKGKSGQRVLSERITVIDLFPECSLFDQRSVKESFSFLCFANPAKEWKQ